MNLAETFAPQERAAKQVAKVIIGIHGLANKPSRETLTGWWEEAIREGLLVNCGLDDAAFDFEMVYWANLLYKNPQHQDPDFDFDALYLGEPYYRADQDALREYKDGWRDRVRAELSDTVGSALDAVRGRVGGDWLTDFVLRSKLKDLDFYWDDERTLKDVNGNSGVAKNMLQAELIAALRKHSGNGNQIMVIAHSMGSIIAYDVLRDLGRPTLSVDVPYFVTIGCPLGLSLVQEHIEKFRWDENVRTPSVVSKKWVNFADPLDPVAVDTHLRGEYGENGRGVRVKDDLVSNDYAVRGSSNHHKSYGYLRTPEMSRLVKEFMESS